MEVVFVGCLGPGIQKPSGVSNYVSNILGELSGMGLSVSLVGVGPEVASDLPYRFVSLSPDDGQTSYGFLMRLFASNPSIDLSSATVINAHRPDDMIPFQLLRKKNPKVTTLHGTHFRNVYLKKGRLVGRAYDFLERFSVERTHHLISVSRKSRDVFLRRYPGKEEYIHFIPPGVDSQTFRRLDSLQARKSLGLHDNDFIVLYAGRLGREKRLDALLRAFLHLKGEMKNARMLIAGEGRERSRLEVLIPSRYSKDINLLGPVPQSKMPRLLSASDVLCLLSSHEGFPSIVLESLACGLPIISTRVGDVPEVVHEGESGSILDTLEPREVARKIAEVGSLREEMAPDCRRIAEGYTWKRVAESTADVYEEVLS